MSRPVWNRLIKPACIDTISGSDAIKSIEPPVISIPNMKRNMPSTRIVPITAPPA